MPVALEDDDGELARGDSLRLRDCVDVLGRRCVDVDHVDPLRPDRDLLHVHGRAGEEHRPPLGYGHDRDRVRLAERRQACTFERIDGHVDLRPGSVADRLPVEEHRRLVLLPLADHDDPVHRDRVEHGPHRIDRGLIGGDLVAAAHPAPGGHRRRLGHTDELEREVAVRGIPFDRQTLHPLRGLDSDQIEAPGDHVLRRADKGEPEGF